MSKGDQAIEAVGGHIVDVVGIQTSRRKRNRENWLREKNSGLNYTMAIRICHQEHNPKGWTWVATSIFPFLEILHFHLACSLTPETWHGVYKSPYQPAPCRQLSFGAINSLRAHTDRFWAEPLYRRSMNLFPFPIIWKYGIKKCKKLSQRFSFRTYKSLSCKMIWVFIR